MKKRKKSDHTGERDKQTLSYTGKKKWWKESKEAR